MYILEDLIRKAVESKASDLHITVGLPPILRINGELTPIGSEILMPPVTETFAKQMITGEQWKRYCDQGEIDFSYAVVGLGRMRVNAFIQRGSHAIALRLITISMPTIDSLGMPEILKDLSAKQRGLILVTGPTGSGKSTTLAAMIDEINNTRGCHVITLEDPIEYLHKHKKSMINQREIGQDTRSFSNALRAALREDPDVILVGEMRDLETISIAITAAETGHLVLSTLHTVGASKTMDRIIDVFPPHQQQQVKVQLSAVIEGVISQQLLARQDGSGRVAALEIMTGTPAIRNLIREGKTHQIDSIIQTSSKYGMKTMDTSLIELYKSEVITYEDAMTYCIDRQIMSRMMNL